jgi:hypothetical protein
MNKTTNKNAYLVKDINSLSTHTICSPTDSRVHKLSLLKTCINTKRNSYNIVGLIDRTTEVVLQPTYYNVRNALGQFASTKARKRARK